MGDVSRAYDEKQSSHAGPPVARVERAQLCELFGTVGAHAPTLIDAWTAHHLAAHLVRRESNPLNTLTLLLASRVADKEVEEMVSTSEFAALVERLGSVPTLSVFSLPFADAKLNTLEFYVHHEDVRRAQPGWSPRALPLWAENQLWTQLTTFARSTMRGSRVGVELVRTDTAGSLAATKSRRQVTVRGRPSELALLAFGRKEVAQVDLEGTAAAVDALMRSDLST